MSEKAFKAAKRGIAFLVLVSLLSTGVLFVFCALLAGLVSLFWTLVGGACYYWLDQLEEEDSHGS